MMQRRATLKSCNESFPPLIVCVLTHCKVHWGFILWSGLCNCIMLSDSYCVSNDFSTSWTDIEEQKDKTLTLFNLQYITCLFKKILSLLHILLKLG